MAKFNFIQQNYQKMIAPISQAYQSLSKRDQFALLALSLFLLVFGLGYGGWTLHEKANISQKNYDTAVADLFWLRSQASNINPYQSQVTSITENIQQIMIQTGITAQILENGNEIQVNFFHSQASVIGNVLNQISEHGLSIEQLQMNQTAVDKIEVQAQFKKN